LKALGVGPGDEVVIPSLTYIAVANAVTYCGATPVITDVDQKTGCMGPENLEAALGPKTKAVIAVHALGHPADMKGLLACTIPRAIPVIEDGSQAFGSKHRGTLVGKDGNLSVFSFFANKIITTGEGGAVLTDNLALFKRMESLRNHAPIPGNHYCHSEIGFNYGMTNLQAAIGCAQLHRLPEIVSLRQNRLDWLKEELVGTNELVLNPSHAWAEPVNWMISLRIGPQHIPHSDEFIHSMALRGFEIRKGFYPLDAQPSLIGVSRCLPCPISREISRRLLFLPSGFGVDRAAIGEIGEALRGWLC
jgi:perosamine synthetase